MFLTKIIKSMSMSEYQVVHLTKSQLLATNKKVPLNFKDLHRIIREINFEEPPGLVDFYNLKSLGCKKTSKLFFYLK